jgi:glycosyltransferase involved in cell wall biosynthesis
LRKKIVMQMVLMGADDPESLKLQYHKLRSVRLGILARMDRFIYISTPLGDSCRRTGLPAGKLCHIPQGVDTQRFCPVDGNAKRAVRSRLGLPADKKIVTFVGSVIHRKGVDVLIDAWESVQRQCPDAELILVGPCDFGSEDYDASSSNAFVDAIRGQISQRALNVRLVGRSSEVESFLQGCDVFVLPSRKEGFPNVIIEAMACGVPVVVTQMDGASRDSVTPGETGIIVSSCEELASALIEVLNNDERRRKLGTNARSDVLRRFALAQIADKYMAIYDELS